MKLDHPCPSARRAPIAWAAALTLATPLAYALEFDTGESEVKIRWDNTVKYSTGFRLKSPSDTLINSSAMGTFGPTNVSLNQDDGNRAFKKGSQITNRVDLLSELDLAYRNFGARFSGAAWYDSVYMGRNDNTSPGTSNQTSAAYNEFTPAARKLHGRSAEVLDAFAYGNHQLDQGGQLTWRVGRHTLQWGESLFFGANGIAGLMAPVDAVKAASVPNTQFKDLMMPVGQVSGQLQIRPGLAVGAYYQYEWRAMRLPASGTYFATLDSTPGGADSLYLGPGAATPHGNDIGARDSGQGGVQVRWRPEGLGTDFGFYALRQHDRAPQLTLVNGAFGPEQYFFTYAENIGVYGVSATTTVGKANFAAELSVRKNNALVSQSSVYVPGTGITTGPARGDTLHLNINAMYQFGPSFLAKEAMLMGEIALNRTLRVTAFASNLDPDVSRDGAMLRVSYTPTYRQVAPGWDLDVPISVGYTPRGRSSAGGGLGPDKGGDVTVGLNATYRDTWFFSIGLTHYFGPAGTTLNVNNTLTYKQSLKDRDFVMLSLRRTF